ncbi:isoleucine--tRNA ligase [Bacteriovoracaceae bacterium]|nr:isoleucine--tRNA ligase [Bacteriovoracaceae bacterium]
MGQEETNQNTQFNFVTAEENILNNWNQKKIFEKSLEKTKDGPRYIFYDGPPFATGLPHHGHLVASTLKDIVPRYFTMKGFYVERRFGWDCHGLPIEQEIDKAYEMSASDYIERHGIKDYNSKCRGIVQKFTKEWEKTISRLGRWVDFENDYKTMDTPFMESIWWVFKSCFDQGLIYQGNKIVPYSTQLQTGLSNFEATSNYQNVQDPAITVLFKLKNEDTYLTAWTTTPWTLPSNLGLIINELVTYVKVKDNKSGKTLIMAKDRLEAYKKIIEAEVLEEFLGKDLIGKEYEPLLPYFADQAKKGAFRVHADNYVTTTDGTGIVHSAPAFGEDDKRVLEEAGVAAFACPIDSACCFDESVPEFQGQFIKDADKNIIKHLKSENKLLHQSVLVHSYPFCPRTDKPLIYRALPQWYLNVTKIKDKMLAANSEINWVPSHIKDGRFGKWLEGARDWAISRNRYWGTPLPLWYNETSKKYVCIGSIDELEKYSGQKLDDLHREYVDDVAFSIDGEEGTYSRISEVLDCWFESGSMPYAQLHYPFENKEIFENGFPAQFIAEGLDQTRGWFYTLTVLSSALFNKPAFKNVIVNGLVLASDGKKMSKRLRNYTPPDDLMNKYGADPLRLTLITSGLVKGEELKFTDDGVKEMVRKALLPWLNSFKFFQTYAKVDGFSFDQHEAYGENILDQFLYSKLNTLIKSVNFEMDQYRLYNVIPNLFEFIEDLTNWYIRLNRRRFWEEGLDKDKQIAYTTLFNALENLSKLMAPFAPFLSDHIFQELREFKPGIEESVHLCDYPSEQSNQINPALEDAVKRMQEIILLGRQKRIKQKIKVKTPLRTITIINKSQDVLTEIEKLEDYIKIELNIKNVEYSSQEADYIELYSKPNSPVLGKKLGKEFGKFRKLIEAIPEANLLKLESGDSIEIEGTTFSPEEILVFRQPKDEEKVATNRFISVSLDCNLDQELINEGLAREVVNRIQKTRKDLDFNVNDRITISFTASDSLKKAIVKNKDYICRETLCKSLDEKSTENMLSFAIDEDNLSILIERA